MSDGKERPHLGRVSRTALATYARLHREIGVAAPQTIAHRTAMLAAALGNPAAIADPEFRRMVEEKVQAGADGVLAAWSRSAALLNPMMAWAGEQMHLNVRLMTDLMTCRLPVDLLAAQLRFSQDSAGNAAAIGSRVSESVAEVLVAGTRPMHKAATANARRLRRKRAGGSRG